MLGTFRDKSNIQALNSASFNLSLKHNYILKKLFKKFSIVNLTNKPKDYFWSKISSIKYKIPCNSHANNSILNCNLK